MGKFTGRKKNKNEHQLKEEINQDIILCYKSAIQGAFRNITNEYDAHGSRNVLFAYDHIDLFSQRIKNFEDYKLLILKSNINVFNEMTISLVRSVYKFFLAIDLYSENNEDSLEHIKSNYHNISVALKILSQFDLELTKIKNVDTAEATRRYCLNLLKEAEYFISNNFFVNIKNSPLNKSIKKLRKKFEKLKLKNNPQNFIDNSSRDLVTAKASKVQDKWYALLYKILLEIKKKDPPLNNDGELIKIQIMEIGASMGGKTGQQFYVSFKSIYKSDYVIIRKTYGNDWKDFIIKLSENNSEIIDFLNKIE